MPRSNGIYTPPSGTTATPQTTISSSAYNAFVNDIAADQNNPRPIIAGGTGAATAGGARTALGLGDAATRDVGTTAGTVAAGDDSRITGALPLDGSAAMTGDLDMDGNDVLGAANIEAIEQAQATMLRFDSQTLTAPQQAQARGNIEAAWVLTGARVFFTEAQSNATIPAGGQWKYFAILTNGDGAIYETRGGIVAGGTVISRPDPNLWVSVSAERIS